MKPDLVRRSLARRAERQIRAQGLHTAAAELGLSPAACLALAIGEPSEEAEVRVAFLCGALLSLPSDIVEPPS